MKQHGGDIYTWPGMLDFSANINPFGSGEKVSRAAKDGVDHMKYYPDPYCRRLRKALASFYQVPDERIVAGNGAGDLIFSLVFAEKPKRAVLVTPSFSEYEQALCAAGCEVLYYHTRREDKFDLQTDYLELLTEDIDMVFLCSPNNPTGRTISSELLDDILRKCQANHIRIVLDECFYDFLAIQEEAHVQRLTGQYSELFLLRAFTKMYAMPGLRLGYGICKDEDLIRRLYEVRQPWSVSVVAEAAGLAALCEEEQKRARQTAAFIEKERKRIENSFRDMEISFIPSEVNYICFQSDPELFSKLLEQKILIRDCRNYRGLGAGDFRIAVRLQEENEILLEAMRQILTS